MAVVPTPTIPIVMRAPVLIMVPPGMRSVMSARVPAMATIPVIAGMRAAMCARMPIVVGTAMPVVPRLRLMCPSGTRQRHRCNQRQCDGERSRHHGLEESMHGILRVRRDASTIQLGL